MRKVREKMLAEADALEEQGNAEKAAQIRAFVEEKLPSKKDQFGGGQKRGSVIDDALKDLGIL